MINSKWFCSVKFVIIPPCFVQQQYLWDITIQPVVGCYNLWTDIHCSSCSSLGEKSLWNKTIGFCVIDRFVFSWKQCPVSTSRVITNYLGVLCELRPQNFPSQQAIGSDPATPQDAGRTSLPIVPVITCRLLALTHWGRQNGRYFPDDIFKCIFLNENLLILLQSPRTITRWAWSWLSSVILTSVSVGE